MFLKGGLSKKGLSLADLKKLGHNLPNIWTKFKTTFNDPALVQFDDAIRSLHDFEDIRYPDLIVAKGMQVAINITSQRTLLNSSRPEPAYWPAPGSEDTELGVLMELEVGHGETEVHAGVQA
jgi:hypothetical protein